MPLRSTHSTLRIFRRWVSSSGSKARKGRKGHLYVPDRKQPPPTPEEEVRITKRRHEKAERDERMDITLALTPPKTYMGGFTRPKDLRASNWFPGGPYTQKGKVYESPPEAAYEPHTVFLLETRYKVRHGVGRVDAKDHITAVCRTADFVKLMAKYNTLSCPRDAKEPMDNACWPFIPKSGKVLKPTKWWGPDEKLEDIMKEIYEDDKYVQEAVPRALLESEEETDEDELPRKKQPKSSDATNIRAIYGPHLATEPFWRPLIAVTVSTRPLALTLSRLAKAHERGLSFIAAISNDDRKCLFSYSLRMTNVRLNRFLQLTREMTMRLAGYKGGFVGIRFNVNDRGRGIGGEGLADPIPFKYRVVRVQVGSWYERADDIYELYAKGGEEWGGPGAVEVTFMNEWGRRLDAEGNEVPLTADEISQNDVRETDEVDRPDEDDQDLRKPLDPQRKSKLKPILRRDDEAAAALRRKLALKQAQGHRSVLRV